MQKTVRPPACAGSFYPAAHSRLGPLVTDLLLRGAVDGPAPKALIAPHAGYAFSGPVAGSAYARIAPLRGTVRRVILVGPAHRLAFLGLAVSSATAFETPLGEVAVDTAAVARIVSLPGVRILDAAHEGEHCLEVHLPFLQHCLDDFSIVPIVVGDAYPGEVAEVLDTLWGGPETLVVVSSDLSHFLPYELARAADEKTARAIEALSPDALEPEQACGVVPIRGLLETAAARGLRVERLDLRSSGDTAGPRDRVVGYGAFGLFEVEA